MPSSDRRNYKVLQQGLPSATVAASSLPLSSQWLAQSSSGNTADINVHDIDMMTMNVVISNFATGPIVFRWQIKGEDGVYYEYQTAGFSISANGNYSKHFGDVSFAMANAVSGHLGKIGRIAWAVTAGSVDITRLELIGR